MKKFLRKAWHPLLIGLYPVLLLFANNQNEIAVNILWRPLIIALALAGLLFLVLRLITRNWRKAGLLTSWVLLLFYTYGHIYSYLKVYKAFAVLGRHRILLIIWGILLIGGLILILRLKALKEWTLILNSASAFLIILSLIQISSFTIQRSINAKRYQPDDNAKVTLSKPDSPPDIYYIILDSYARQDVMADKYQFDNSAFIQALRDMGFYVADCSRSNYVQTELSLSSSLNYTYLDELLEEIAPASTDRASLRVLIEQSVVQQQLVDIGYETVAFQTGYDWSTLSHVDYYFEPSGSGFASAFMRPFESMLLDTTFIRAVSDSAIKLLPGSSAVSTHPQAEHIERQLYILDKLSELPQMPGPQFIFAHLIIPHPPFVFGTGGVKEIQQIDNQDADTDPDLGYLDQVRYTNERMLPLLQTLIDDSDVPPIIILQADHGWLLYRPCILNAYYFPGRKQSYLYEDISPVNTFRVVFNAYFGTDLPLLEEKSYYSRYATPFKFSVFEEPYPACKE
ncbi:MAG: sulfatase-like hydrolase/transferase [Chloroflexota bacterium]